MRRGLAGIRRGLFPLAFFVFLFGSPTSQAALTAEEFIASPGAQAFEAEDYEAALNGFWDLLLDDPNDATVLRYYGITLDRLGRSEEAVTVLTRALELSPDDPAIMLFLGVSLYKLGHFSNAQAFFDAVLARAPETEYADWARDFITVIATQSAPEVSPSPERAFDAYLQVGFAYDDNVNLGQDNVPLALNPFAGPPFDVWRAVEFLSFGYNIVDSGPWIVRAKGHGYGNQNFEERLPSYDIGQVGAAIEAEYAAQLGTVAVVPTIGFESELNFQDYRTFSHGYGVDAELDIGWSEWFKTSVFYNYQIAEFEDREITFQGDAIADMPELMSRDNTNHRAGVKQNIIAELGDVIMVLSGGYEYTKMNAEGINFDAHGHKASGGLTLYLPGEVVIDVFGSRIWNTRPTFLISSVGGTRLKIDTYSAGVTLAVPIADSVRGVVSYEYTNQDAHFPGNPIFDTNAGLLAYTRSVVTIALSYTLY